MKFCTAKQTQVPVGHAKFDVNWFNERGEKLYFWPVSKFNTCIPALRHPAGNKNNYLPERSCRDKHSVYVVKLTLPISYTIYLTVY